MSGRASGPQRVRRARAAGAVLAAALAVGGGALAAPHPANASPARAQGTDGQQPGAGQDPLATIAAIRDYWTPARMRAATPVAARVGAQPVRRRIAGTTANTRPGGTAGVYTPKSVGKLFFSDRNNDYVCTAAAIATASRNQVLTAGHCVHTGPHPEDGGLLGLPILATPHYFSNWVFVPRYTNGRAPEGKWVVTNVYVADGWTKRESFTQDQAILTVARLNRHSLTAVVGGNKVAMGRKQGQKGVRIWGWPAASPYNGQRSWRCDGPTRPTTIASPGDAKMTCGLNGGASGGPWMMQKNRTTNTGTIFAVTSRITTSGPELVLAHPLPWSLQHLIDAAGG